jgi:phosphoglycerol transferase MdoB-like AlkP superfamily enzyme
MPERTSNLLPLLKKLLGLMVLYSICRLFFLLFNLNYFSGLAAGDIFRIFFFGTRFDLSVIILSNSLFLILYLLPMPFRERPSFRSILKWLFILVNSLAMIANCVDMAYFGFTLKRSTADIFNFFGGKIGNDAGRLIPLFLVDYWYLVILGIALSLAVAFLYKRTEPLSRVPLTWKQAPRQALIFIVVLVIAVIGYRGGLQLKPVSMVDAASYTSAKNVSLLLNTPFTILKTLDLEAIQPTIYYSSEEEMRRLYDPLHKPSHKQMKKLNVVLIALESFSKEYVGSINGRKEGYTPFLDSLISQGLVFTNAYANGKKSIEGIPSISASIPSWMNEPFISSPYGGNQISSIASLLKTEGYSTSFFHGGTNGTMGFDAYAGLAGYDKYYGRKEYNNEADYDGNWGIWDEEFLQYTAQTINSFGQPFFSTIFTLTSHHPYTIPKKHNSRFADGSLPIHRSIRYSDYALQRFFASISKMPWYNNTLFVLCADHTGTSADPFYTNKVGNNAVPILYFMPGDTTLRGRSARVTQQIDVMPSILDYLHYPKSHFSFGSSVFDSTALHFAMSINGGQYDLIEDDHVLSFNGTNATELYHFTIDSLLSKNLISADTLRVSQMEQRVKAIIQTYQQSLINNKMH